MRIKFTFARKGKTAEVVTSEIDGRIERAMSANAHDFERAAKLRCPVSGTVRRIKGQRGVLEAQRRIPGRLRASITSRTWKRGWRHFGSCGFTEPYGFYLEFGSPGPKKPIVPRKDGGKRALAWIGGRPRGVVVRKKSRGGPIEVGTARRPNTFWKALSERTGKRQTMPFLRPAWYLDTLSKARERFLAALSSKGA